MQNNIIRILFIGDIIGKSGRGIVLNRLKRIKTDNSIDFIIANGENLAGGFGLTQKIAESMFKAGINVLTSGNHIWNNSDVMNIIGDRRILRPYNYAPGVPGRGYGEYEFANYTILVINLEGRIFMKPIDCPFRTIDVLLEKTNKNTISIIDFHAEATAEKQALANYVDGRVSAVIGTHTHVQTADERILPNGTGYITDAGMTGGLDSIIGFKKKLSIKKIIDQMPSRLSVSNDLPVFNGVIIDIDVHTQKTVNIKRIFEYDKD